MKWKPEALEPVLLHELIHIKRRDCLVNSVQSILQILYFYHPMVWFANHTVRRERELACDDEVVRRSGGCSTAYVHSMLQAAETFAHEQRLQLLGIAMAENFSNLGKRVQRMMRRNYRASARYGFASVIVALSAGLFCAAVSAQNPERSAATDLVFDPIITQEQVIPYLVFARAVREEAATMGIPQMTTAAILHEFEDSNAVRVILPHELRYTLLELLYKDNVPYDVARRFLQDLEAHPVDTGFLAEVRTIDLSGKQVWKVRQLGEEPKAPKPIQQPLPAYTPAARVARVQGTIAVSCTILEDGSVANCRVVRPLGFGLDESAVSTIQNDWKFEPATMSGQHVPVLATIEVTMRLY